MKTLFDTSVLHPMFVMRHVNHDAARVCLERVMRGEDEMYLSTHALAELYATLTGSPMQNRIDPLALRHMIRHNIEPYATLVPLDRADYFAAVDNVITRDLRSGVIYDALHVQAAKKVNADQLLTYNLKHFERLWPDHNGVIRSP